MTADPHPASLPSPRCCLCDGARPAPAPFVFAPRGCHADELRSCLPHRDAVEVFWTLNLPLPHPEATAA